MAEIFDKSIVKATIKTLEDEFVSLAESLEKVNACITKGLGSPDQAVYGDAGNKILATWDENSSTLKNFISIFDNWSSTVAAIASEYAELDTGLAKIDGLDVDNFKTISNANKTTWLGTAAAAKSYAGSTSKYTDVATGTKYTETTNLKNGKMVQYVDSSGNKVKEYYDLSGKLIKKEITGKFGKKTYEIDGKTTNDPITKAEKAEAEKLKKAQSALKESVTKKHEEKAARDKERTSISKYKNPYGLVGHHLSFIESVIPGAIKAYKDYGVLPSLTLSQAIFESGWGTSNLSVNHNNFFGIKTGTAWTGASYKGWREYSSLADSIDDHGKLLSKSWYRPVIEAKNYEDACYKVVECGYCPTSTYAPHLIEIIKQYGLDQWDPK